MLYVHTHLEAYVATLDEATSTQKFTQSLQLFDKRIKVQPNWLYYHPLFRLAVSH